MQSNLKQVKQFTFDYTSFTGVGHTVGLCELTWEILLSGEFTRSRQLFVLLLQFRLFSFYVQVKHRWDAFGILIPHKAWAFFVFSPILRRNAIKSEEN